MVLEQEVSKSKNKVTLDLLPSLIIVSGWITDLSGEFKAVKLLDETLDKIHVTLDLVMNFFYITIKTQ
jgi:hypothetical protein